MIKNKGISLITLVITIVVMIILAGAIILTLSSNGIIDRANEAVEKTNIQQIESLATMLWAEAYEKSDGSQGALYTAVMDGLNNNGITADKYDGYRIDVTESGVKVVKLDTATDDVIPPTSSDDLPTVSGDEPSGGTVVHEGIIPTGAIYRQAIVTWTYNEIAAGESFPSQMYTGDQYVYGDYIYTYSSYRGSWSVRVSNAYKTEYGTILESINGIAVTSLEYTFENCTSLTTAPTIPTSITNITGAFLGCNSLTRINYSGTTDQWNAITKDNWYSTSAIRVIYCIGDNEDVCPGHDNLSISTAEVTICPTCGREFWP